jgi:FkbM family methyltransferase
VLIIYDVGSNNGDDIPYYLLKSDLVVAIEANPGLCDVIRRRFASEIQAGRLVVENCVVTADAHAPVDFYLHKTSHVLSQMPEPDEGRRHLFNRVELPGVPIHHLIERHGHPHYVKIDLEHLDAAILNALFDRGIFPDYLSAESHSVDVFSLLVARGGYDSFKLVDGHTVPKVYGDRAIESIHGNPVSHYAFPVHSAGPFGPDVDGDWMSAEAFFRYLAIQGMGWKDVHATRCHAPAITALSDQHLAKILAAKLQGKSLILHRAPG